MAIVRKNFAVHDEGRCVCWYEYDDQPSRRWITALGVDNNSDKSCWVRASVIADPIRSYERVVAAHTSESVAVPTNQAARAQFFINANGKLDGVSLESAWPAP